MAIDISRQAAERRALMESIWVETPRTAEAFQKFDYLIDHSEVSASSKLCVLLVAPSQSGKSRLIRKLVEAKNPSDVLKARKIPILHVTLHAEVTRKQLAQDILLAIQEHGFETGPLRGSEAELWERVYHYLRVAKVDLLVLDEIHHVKTTSEAMARSVGECIKHALLKGPCPIVLSGIHAAELPFKHNEQLQQRAIPSIELNPFAPSEPADTKMFVEFLAEYLVRMEEVGVAHNATALIDGDVPACILEVSGGVLGAACRLLMEAVTYMIKAERNSLSREDLVRATDEAFVRPGLRESNPFIAGLGAIG